MRKSLINLLNKTIVFEYNLTNSTLNINKSIYTKNVDYCYSVADSGDFEKLIYNSIVDYAFNENEFEGEDLNDLNREALSQRIRIEDSDSYEAKYRYGVYGETILNLLLVNYFRTNAIIAKGYFYDVLKPEENKGYDSFY